jgi:hypothetical protein
MPTASSQIRDDEDDLDDGPYLRPADRIRPRRPVPWLRAMLLSGVAIAGLTHLAHRQAGDEPPQPGIVPQTVLIAPPPAWQPIAAPSPVYALDAPEAEPRPVWDARRHAGGGREDTLTIGSFGDPGHARLRLSRSVAGPVGGSFYVDLVRRAAEAGLSVARSGQSRPLPTKFGPVEAADVVLSEAREQTCIAFRYAHPDVDFGFRGWLCGAGDKPVGETQLRCFVDRLSLAPATDDPVLRVLFARSEGQRDRNCAPVARLEPPRLKPPARS